MNHLVGIINLSKMTLTNEFLVTKTFVDGNQADTNLISVQNTRFMMYLNNKNLLELNDDDVLMIFLLHGNLDYQKFRIVGKQQYFKIDDTILEYLRPMIFEQGYTKCIPFRSIFRIFSVPRANVCSFVGTSFMFI